jgi:hypothetical protein
MHYNSYAKCNWRKLVGSDNNLQVTLSITWTLTPQPASSDTDNKRLIPKTKKMKFIIFWQIKAKGLCWLIGTSQHKNTFYTKPAKLFIISHHITCYVTTYHSATQLSRLHAKSSELNESIRMLWIELNFGSKICCVFTYRTPTPLSAALSSTQKLCMGPPILLWFIVYK